MPPVLSLTDAFQFGVYVIYVDGGEDAHIYIWREAKEQRICLPLSLPPYLMRWALSLNLELTDQDRGTGQGLSGLHLPRNRIAGTHAHVQSIHVGTGGLNSAPHGCTASSLLAAPSPDPIAGWVFTCFACYPFRGHLPLPLHPLPMLLLASPHSPKKSRRT